MRRFEAYDNTAATLATFTVAPASPIVVGTGSTTLSTTALNQAGENFDNGTINYTVTPAEIGSVTDGTFTASGTTSGWATITAKGNEEMTATTKIFVYASDADIPTVPAGSTAIFDGQANNWGPDGYGRGSQQTDVTIGGRIMRFAKNLGSMQTEKGGGAALNALNVSGFTTMYATIYTPTESYVNVTYEGLNVDASSLTNAYKHLNAGWNTISIPFSELVTGTFTSATWLVFDYSTDGTTRAKGEDNAWIIANIYYNSEGASPQLNTLTTTPDATAELTKGDDLTITATTTDQFGEAIDATISYASSDPTVLTVDNATGKVKAVNYGSATITVTATQGEIQKAKDIAFNVLLPEPTAPTYAKENVAVIWSETYGKTTLNDNNNTYGIQDVPDTYTFTNTAYVKALNNHQIVKVTGSLSNGRIMNLNADPAAAISTEDYQVVNIALFPTTATKATLFGDNKYGTTKTTVDVTPGQWNYISLPKGSVVSEDVTYLLVLLAQEDGTPETEFYFDHWFVAKDVVAPELVSASLAAYDAVSATVKLKATDDHANPVSFKINVKDDADFNVNYTDATAPNNTEDTYKIKGLTPGTLYHITVKAYDGANESDNEITFDVTTSALTPAVEPTTLENILNIYSDKLASLYVAGDESEANKNKQNHINAAYTESSPINYNENTATIAELTIPAPCAYTDNAYVIDGAESFVISHAGTDANYTKESVTKLYDVANIAFFVTGDVSTLTLTPLFYQNQTNNIGTAKDPLTVNVTPNQWNYFTFKPSDYRPTNYTIKDDDNNDVELYDLYALKVEGMKGNAIFFDNFYYASNDDQTPPVFVSATGAGTLKQEDGNTDALVAVDAKPYTAEFTVKAYDTKSRVIRYDFGINGPTLESEENIDRWYGETVGIYEEAGEAAAQDVKFYMNNLRPNSEYVVTVYATDEAANQSETTVKFHTAALYEGTLEKIGTKDDDGKIALHGYWNAAKFNEIDKATIASCYDLTEVDFTSSNAEREGERIERGIGAEEYHTWNPNAIIISPILNKFNGNYVMRNPDGTYTGFNIVYHDGDWLPGDYRIDGTVAIGGEDKSWRQEVINAADTEAKVTALKDLRAIDYDEYLIVEPYTAWGTKLVSYDNFAYTRQLTGMENKAVKFATVVFPFICEPNNLATGLKLYDLTSATEDGDGTIKVNFTQVTATTVANKPYLVESTGLGGTIDFLDSNLPKTIEFPTSENLPSGTTFTNTFIEPNASEDVHLIASYVTQDVDASANIYNIPNDNTDLELAHYEGGITFVAFRAAVKVKKTDSNDVKFVLSFEEPQTDENGETTVITRPATDAEINAVFGNVYSIDGQLVRQNTNQQNAFMGLPAGIYIVNGKKVVVK